MVPNTLGSCRTSQGCAPVCVPSTPEGQFPTRSAAICRPSPHNVQGLGLVFVAVYQRALKLLYVDALLERVRADFSRQYSPKRYDYASFEELFRCCLPAALCSCAQLWSAAHQSGWRMGVPGGQSQQLPCWLDRSCPAPCCGGAPSPLHHACATAWRIRHQGEKPGVQGRAAAAPSAVC